MTSSKACLLWSTVSYPKRFCWGFLMTGSHQTSGTGPLLSRISRCFSFSLSRVTRCGRLAAGKWKLVLCASPGSLPSNKADQQTSDRPCDLPPEGATTQLFPLSHSGSPRTFLKLFRRGFPSQGVQPKFIIVSHPRRVAEGPVPTSPASSH